MIRTAMKTVAMACAAGPRVWMSAPRACGAPQEGRARRPSRPGREGPLLGMRIGRRWGIQPEENL